MAVPDEGAREYAGGPGLFGEQHEHAVDRAVEETALGTAARASPAAGPPRGEDDAPPDDTRWRQLWTGADFRAGPGTGPFAGPDPKRFFQAVAGAAGLDQDSAFTPNGDLTLALRERAERALTDAKRFGRSQASLDAVRRFVYEYRDEELSSALADYAGTVYRAELGDRGVALAASRRLRALRGVLLPRLGGRLPRP